MHCDTESQLFDLLNDPDETNDLAAEEAETVSLLKAALRRHLRETGLQPIWDLEGVDLTPVEIENLKALGYLR